MKPMKFVLKWLRKWNRRRKKKAEYRKRSKEIRRQLDVSSQPVPDLTEPQIAEIRAYWNRYGIDPPLEWHKLFYAKTGKQLPDFIPKPVFNTEVRPYLNDARLAGAWSDKAYLDYFVRGVRTPECVLRNVSGRLLDHDFHLISLEQAQSVLDAYDRLVIKPTLYTHTGMGVQLLEKPYDLASIIAQYQKNFVIQLPLRQHKELAKLNASSVNTVRVDTVLLDNHAHVMSCFVKVGESGQFADNNGSRRYFIGVRSEDGTYQDYAIDHDLNRYTEIPSGYAFANQPVACFDKVCEAACRAHECVGHFGLAFWDICVCEDGEAAVVEMNLRNPDSTIAQVTGEPYLGKYTEQILELVSKRRASERI